MFGIIFGFIWGMVFGCILKSLGGSLFDTWQYWAGVLVPVLGVTLARVKGRN